MTGGGGAVLHILYGVYLDCLELCLWEISVSTLHAIFLYGFSWVGGVCLYISTGVRSFWLFKKAVGIVFVAAVRGYQCVYGGISF